MLKEWAGLLALQEGRYIHCHVVKYGIEMDFYVVSTCIDMNAKCGDLMNVRKMFEKFSKWNFVSLNALIATYSQNVHVGEALALYNHSFRCESHFSHHGECDSIKCVASVFEAR